MDRARRIAADLPDQHAHRVPVAAALDHGCPPASGNGVPTGIGPGVRPNDEATAFRLAPGYEKQTGHRESPEFQP